MITDRIYEDVAPSMKEASMQRPGTVAIRTQIPPSKPKPEITKLQIVKYKKNNWSTE